MAPKASRATTKHLREKVRPGRLLAVTGVLLGISVLTAAPASAACHHFSVAANPATVTEGASVTVTVSRDGNVGPSQVDVSTVDATAKAGRDYTPLTRTVSFTSETAQSFTIHTLDDHAASGTRAFRLHLSHPGGCTVNPNYVVDPDATVTIRDTGTASSTPRPTPPPAPASPSATVSRPPVATPTASPRPATSPATPRVSAAPLPPTPAVSHTTPPALESNGPTRNTSDGNSRGPSGAQRARVVAASVVALIALVGGAVALLRRRRARN